MVHYDRMARTRKKLTPRAEVLRKMRPITRDVFTRILNKAARTPVPKRAAK